MVNATSQITIRGVTVCATILILVWLSGCAFMPDNWPVREETLNVEALTKVKRIALLDVSQPSHIWLGKPDSSTAGFINPLISLAVTTHEGDTITNSAYISETTQKEMLNWLEQAGIEVILLEAERTNKHKILNDYAQFAQVNADAILEIAPVEVGFKHEGTKTRGKLSPEVVFTYRLILVKSGQILIESNVRYSSFDYSNKVSWVGNSIRGPSWNTFDNVEAIKDNPEEAIRRLTYAIKGATKLISIMITN